MHIQVLAKKKNSLVYRVTARNVNKSTPALQLMICNDHIKETPPETLSFVCHCH